MRFLILVLLMLSPTAGVGARAELVVLGAPIPPSVIDVKARQGFVFDLFRALEANSEDLRFRYEIVPTGRVYAEMQRSDRPWVMFGPDFGQVPTGVVRLTPLWQGASLILLPRKGLVAGRVRDLNWTVARQRALCAPLTLLAPKAVAREFDDIAAMLAVLNAGRVDAVCHADIEIGYQLRRAGLNWGLYGKPVALAPVVWLLYASKGLDVEMRGRILAAVRKMERSGELRKLFDGYARAWLPGAAIR